MENVCTPEPNLWTCPAAQADIVWKPPVHAVDIIVGVAEWIGPVMRSLRAGPG